jgi:hypothetical protein
MAVERSGSRLVVGLWTAAALFAWLSVFLRYQKASVIEWRGAAAGLFCAAMALGAWARARGTRPPP